MQSLSRQDGNIQTFCGLKLSDIGIPNIGTSSAVARGGADLKRKAIVDTSNPLFARSNRRKLGPQGNRTARKPRKQAALSSYTTNTVKSDYYSYEPIHVHYLMLTTGAEVSYHNIGAPSYQCRSCNTTMWFEERNNKGNKTVNPTFLLCCQEADTQPRYAQLWFFDTHNEIRNRLGAFIDNETGEEVDGTIVGSLIEMLDRNSSIAKAFRMARDWCHSHTSVNVELRLLSERTNSRQYNAPTVAEVAALITNDFGDGEPTRDIVVN
ncbi:hypothetical protein Tco_0797690 [Tanacetum coccineum]